MPGREGTPWYTGARGIGARGYTGLWGVCRGTGVFRGTAVYWAMGWFGCNPGSWGIGEWGYTGVWVMLRRLTT